MALYNTQQIPQMAYVLGNDNNNIFVTDNMSEYKIDDFT
jgi:hypothetical protein